MLNGPQAACCMGIEPKGSMLVRCALLVVEVVRGSTRHRSVIFGTVAHVAGWQRAILGCGRRLYLRSTHRKQGRLEHTSTW